MNIATCTVDANDVQMVDVVGALVNSLPQVADYSVNIALVQGTVHVGEADAFVNGVAPRQTAIGRPPGFPPPFPEHRLVAK